MFKLFCNKNDAYFQEVAILTSGRVGEQISFTFSPDWDRLLKTAVFIAGKESRDVVLTEDTCNIPPEVLVFPGENLRVGVFGETADKTLVIPTIYASAGIIRPGASPSGMSSTPPTPSWPEQVQAIAVEAISVADSVRSDANEGKFNGPAGEPGGWYTPAVTQPDEHTLRVAFTPSKEDMPAVAETDITLPADGGSGTSGEDGGYYAPSVDNEGNLTWTASKTDMPAVDGANIKGPKGDTGAPGAQGPQGPAGANGADGKSAYAYAVEGGYTGTEMEFAAKLAEEMPATLPNPNALTFTGAVTGSYDGSAALSVEIPSGGGAWRTIGTQRMDGVEAAVHFDLSGESIIQVVVTALRGTELGASSATISLSFSDGTTVAFYSMTLNKTAFCPKNIFLIFGNTKRCRQMIFARSEASNYLAQSVSYAMSQGDVRNEDELLNFVAEGVATGITITFDTAPANVAVVTVGGM